MRILFVSGVVQLDKTIPEKIIRSKENFENKMRFKSLEKMMYLLHEIFLFFIFYYTVVDVVQ